MADHDALIAQFIEISGGEENVARFYLSSSNWSLEVGSINFFIKFTNKEKCYLNNNKNKYIT